MADKNMYSKGNWYSEEESGLILTIPDGANKSVIVADLSNTTPKTIGETEANANLIAAAPDNYEANILNLSFLKALVGQYQEFASDFRVQALIATNEAAIAKAEGK